MPGTRICKTNARLLKFHITLLQIIIAYALLAIPQVGIAQTISNLAGDPQGGIGFNRAHWATSINKMIVAFGTSGPGARGDNSVRAFDPVTNKWEYLWPNSNGASGLPNRDNHGSLYVPRLDEFWVYLSSVVRSRGTRQTDIGLLSRIPQDRSPIRCRK